MRRRASKKKPVSKKNLSKTRIPKKAAKKALKARAKSLKQAVGKVPPFLLTPEAEGAPAVVQNSREDRRLPDHYGDDRLVLLVRDPWWLFAYWEVTPGRQQDVCARAGLRDSEKAQVVLRIYDVTGGAEPSRANAFFDITLNFFTNNWYIDVGAPDREWIAELGYLVNGRFYVLLRSNRVQTPAFGLSDVLDEEWMLPEDVYFRLLGRSIGSENAGSSMDFRRLMERYLKNAVSSERLPESSKKVQHSGAPTTG